MRTLLWCAVMNIVWLGIMAFFALQEFAHFDARAIAGTSVAWLFATAASWMLLRRSVRKLALWEFAVVTAPASLVALVLVTTGAWFVSPPLPNRPAA